MSPARVGSRPESLNGDSRREIECRRDQIVAAMIHTTAIIGQGMVNRERISRIGRSSGPTHAKARRTAPGIVAL